VVAASPPDSAASPDRTHCPLCGGPNACGMEAARAQGAAIDAMPPCWCTRLSFPKSLLARLPADAQGVACICEACVRRAIDDEARQAPARP